MGPFGKRAFEKSPMSVQKSPISKMSPVFLQNVPTHVLKSPIPLEKSPTSLQKSPISLQKSPIWLQKRPLSLQNEPYFLWKSLSKAPAKRFRAKRALLHQENSKNRALRKRCQFALDVSFALEGSPIAVQKAIYPHKRALFLRKRAPQKSPIPKQGPF